MNRDSLASSAVCTCRIRYLFQKQCTRESTISYIQIMFSVCCSALCVLYNSRAEWRVGDHLILPGKVHIIMAERSRHQTHTHTRMGFESLNVSQSPGKTCCVSSLYIALLWFHSSSLYETHPWSRRADGRAGWKLYTHDAEINKLLPDEKLAGGESSELVSGC